MKRRIGLISICMVLGSWQTARAVGTPANTAITTQATAQYQVGTATLTQNSNPVSTTVAELIDVHLTWQDSTPVVTHPMDTDQILTFRITNTGNGTESFALTGTGAVSGDQFDPTITAIYLDSNGNAFFEAGIDTLYAAGVNDPTLAPDAAMTIFALSNIPGSLNDGDSGHCRLSISAASGTGLPGDSLGAVGEGGTEAIIGASGASANAIGTFAIANANVSVVKTASVSDAQGGDRPSNGAIVTYQIEIQVTGTGTARSVVFSDPIPAGTAYQFHSLQLNGTPLSDALDGDAGDMGISSANAVTVNLGDLTAGSPVQTIAFDVRIH